MSECCSNDATMCKFVEKCHPGSNKGISPNSIGKLKGQPSFTGFAVKILSGMKVLPVGILGG